MEDLVRIIRILQPAEIRFVEKFYGGKAQKKASRRLQLFRLIATGKVRNNPEAARVLYGQQAASSSLCQLKKRLKEDILNVLLLLPAEKVYSAPFVKAELDCRKLLIQGKILLARGDLEDSLPLLAKVARVAAKYELPEIKLAVDDLLRTHLGLSRGPQSYRQYSDHIDQDLAALQEQLHAKTYSHQIMLPHLFAPPGQVPPDAAAPPALSRLREGYERTQSPWVGYWYLLAAIHCASHTHNYAQAHAYGLQLQLLIERKPALTSAPNKSRVHLELIRALLCLHDYPAAATQATAAARLLRSSQSQYLQALELLFYACFRQQDYQRARHQTEQALRHPHLTHDPALSAKWNFLEANRLLAGGQPRPALQILHAHHILRQDKPTSQVGYKLLELLCLLEIGDYDWFEFTLESFRKLLRHKTLPADFQNRCKSGCQLFRALLKANFHFPTVLQLEKPTLELLQTEAAAHRWNPLGPEQIRIDAWFVAKAVTALPARG